jgi:hypothetical protein
VPPRARTVIKAVWPQTPHRRPPRSRPWHGSQIRCPAASRATTCLTTPQCAHSAVIWRAAHDLHMPGRRAVKRYPGPAAAGARGQGQGRRPAGDQLGGQPFGGQRSPVTEHVRIGGQRRAQRGRAGQRAITAIPGREPPGPAPAPACRGTAPSTSTKAAEPAAFRAPDISNPHGSCTERNDTGTRCNQIWCHIVASAATRRVHPQLSRASRSRRQPAPRQALTQWCRYHAFTGSAE